MKQKKKILIILFLTGIFLLFHNKCYAGTQKLNSLDYSVQLNADGSMDVEETWDIYVSETNTLFKDFEIDSSKYAGITNVQVTDLETELNLMQIGQEMYHVTKGCYYGLPVSGGKFEIAWGVGLDNSSDNRKYRISYTIQDAITVYQDCSEMYWQFVNESNGIPAKKVTGTIKLPQPIRDLENLRVWAHGPLNGEIFKVSNDTIMFEVEDFDSQTMLEARVVTDKSIFPESIKVMRQSKLEEIIAEETEWADKANRERRKWKAIFAGIFIVYIVGFLFFAKKITRYWKELKALPKDKYQVDIGQYFRDIPREKEATPAEAAYLYNFPLNGKENYVISSTLLQLCLKGYISFEKEGKKDIRINLLKPVDENLKESEKLVYRLLTWPAGVSRNQTVTMEEIEKCLKRRYDEFNVLMKELRECAQDAHTQYGNYDPILAAQSANYKTKSLLYMMAVILGVCFLIPFIIFMIPILLEWLISSIILGKAAKRTRVLTEQGEIERQQWKGLKNYMEDFSLLKDRDIPDLVLWEKYLIYATVFGISDKVVKQLKIVYPQIQNLDHTTYTYMYLMSDTRFSNGFIGDLNKSTNSAYSAYKSAYSSAHYSSGSGSGGGFSGGGGGRRWRRSEWADAKRFWKRRKYENRN